MISGPPPDPVPVPATVHRLAGVATIRPVWRNELGGVTFQLGAGSGRRLPNSPFRWLPEDGQPAPGVESEHLVVCHGDACAPNTLVDPSGR
jgi:kanamycin kinase